MFTIKRVLKGGIARVSRATALLQTKVGGKGRFCNACQQPVARFYSYGGRPWGCPLCRSSTRERLVIELIDQKVLPLPSSVGSLLHVAPSETGVIARFSGIEDYHPVDLFPDLYPEAETQRMDLMKLDSVERYDVVYLSHVMEHVPDDIHVYQNLFRSLKPGGQAWILVPLWDKLTIEGNDEMSPRERERKFGQWDHARQYGPDLKDRMEQCGFKVDVIRAPCVEQGLFERLGLFEGDTIFRGTKIT